MFSTVLVVMGWSKTKIGRIRVIVVLCVLSVILALLAPRAWRWIEIDRCLDRGGAWNYPHDRCDT